MKHFYTISLTFAFLIFGGTAAYAQETQERVVDEVIAQVNEGVITLSRIKRESRIFVEEAIRSGKSPEEAQRLVDEKQGELIANLINEELLIQKAKELNLDPQVDATVNERFAQVMKQYNLRTMDALHEEMRKSGVDPTEIREGWRRQAVRELVFQREIHAKEYWRPNSKELRDFYEKNKARFTKPATISLSEIFLSFAGRDENATREKAKTLVSQLRGGADFAKIVAENSDRPDAAKSLGKVEPIEVSELDEKFAAALKDVKVGGYTDPVEIDDIGINILRVDARTAASSESEFNENAVRMAIMQERLPEATKSFMATIREESYIKIGETYRPIVSPILYADERKAKTPSK
ncbi:MAG TPA: peptidyl-prolyl cis-trans isomerase [Pyrinomonadaceae bacterium]|nr:peptidyl-prolyl cis-trans isomerase [Pyrinomonadaceae bacterium]